MLLSGRYKNPNVKILEEPVMECTVTQYELIYLLHSSIVCSQTLYSTTVYSTEIVSSLYFDTDIDQ